MADADDYVDAPPPDPTASEQPGDLRLADRVQLTGWLGLLTAFVLGAAALIYGLVGSDHRLGWVVGLAVPAAVYAAAGGHLIAVGFFDRPPRGELLFMSNLVIVVPVLCAAVIGPLLPVGLIVFLCLNPAAATWSVLAPLPLIVVNYVVLAIAAIKNRRRVIARVRAWLDPTAP